MDKKITFDQDFDKDLYKDTKLKELKIGDKATLVGKAFIKKLTNKNDQPYILLKLSSEGFEVSQFIWNNLPIFDYVDNYIEDGAFVEIQAIIEGNQEKLSMDIKNISILTSSRYVPTEEELKKELRERIENINTPFLKSLIVDILNHSTVKENMFISPATEKTAYNYRGGVAHLIIDTMDLARNTAVGLNEGFGKQSSLLDVDLLVATAFLCNIGRLFTLRMNSDLIVKTDEGQLENDAIYARDILSKAIDNVLNKRDEDGVNIFNIKKEYLNELLHIVSSAKGRPEFGSLTTPRSKHALILSNINTIVYTKGLFDNLESENKLTKENYIRSYENGKVYFIGDN